MFKAQAVINSRRRKALQEIGVVTDLKMGEFSRDVSEMSRALLRDAVKEGSTGNLESTIDARRLGDADWAVDATAKNEQGHGYGAANEWGYHKPDGTRIRGKHMTTRALFGMFKRWLRGERWKP